MYCVYLGMQILFLENNGFALYFVTIAALVAGVVFCEVLLWTKPKSNVQLHIVVIAVSVCAGCAAAIVAQVSNKQLS